MLDLKPHDFPINNKINVNLGKEEVEGKFIKSHKNVIIWHPLALFVFYETTLVYIGKVHNVFPMLTSAKDPG